MYTPTQEVINLTSQEKQTTTTEAQTSVITSLVQLNETQQQLTQVKDNLNSIFDAMAENPSLFSQAATYWGDLPLWQKIIGGIIITIPTLTAGIVVNIGALIAISGVTVIGYTATSLLLDDHNNCNTLILERLRQGINSLADILAITIMALDNIRLKFEKGIERFIEENFKLTQNITQLSGQVDLLTDQVEQFIDTEKQLRLTKEALEIETKKLKKSVDKQDEILQQTQQQLIAAQNEYHESQNQLSEKIVELRIVRTSMEEEIAKAKSINEVLSHTVQDMAIHVVADGEQRKAFDARLQSFVTDVDKSFVDITDKICKADEEAKQIRDELKHTTESYHELLEIHQKQIIRLEQVEKELSKQNALYKRTIGGQALTNFFGSKQSINNTPLTTKTICVI